MALSKSWHLDNEGKWNNITGYYRKKLLSRRVPPHLSQLPGHVAFVHFFEAFWQIAHQDEDCLCLSESSISDRFRNSKKPLLPFTILELQSEESSRACYSDQETHHFPYFSTSCSHNLECMVLVSDRFIQGLTLEPGREICWSNENLKVVKFWGVLSNPKIGTFDDDLQTPLL